VHLEEADRRLEVVRLGGEREQRDDREGDHVTARARRMSLPGFMGFRLRNRLWRLNSQCSAA
jgi:hypothetical protein